MEISRVERDGGYSETRESRKLGESFASVNYQAGYLISHLGSNRVFDKYSIFR